MSWREVGENLQHLADAHAGAEIIENVGHGDAGAADARFALRIRGSCVIRSRLHAHRRGRTTTPDFT